jgi:hypothetical protein
MAEQLTMVPSPERLEVLGNTLNLAGATVQTSDQDAPVVQVAGQLQAGLRLLSPSAPADRARARVVLEMAAAQVNSPPDAYSLHMAEDEVRLRAAAASGLFYGAQTLLQLAEPSQATAVPRVAVEDRPLIPHRAVHLDLRSNCLMPTFDYLIETIKELARYKINAVVLEWEDKFPYRRHPEIASPLALTPEQAQELLAVAARHHVQVIPLVQTLGHVEYVLKHPRYAGLRERAGDISQFCPCEPGSLHLVRELLDEVLAAHPDARFVHLGGDEPWLLGSCPRCAAKAQDHGLLAVYLDHLAAVCRHVIAAGKLPIIWGDVVLGQHVDVPGGGWSQDETRALESLPREVRMMYWDYHGLRPSDFTRFDDYRRRGFTVWVAPTTRYGDIVPDYATHLPNIAAFLQAGIAHGAEGALITSWAWKNMPFEMTWHGLVCAAERAWSGGRLDQDELAARAVRAFHGADLPEYVEAMRLLSYDYWATSYKDELGRPIHSSYLSRNPGHEYPIPEPAQVRDNARRAHELLATARGKAARRPETLAAWEVAARLVAHAAEKQILFDAMERLPARPAALLDRAGLAGLQEGLERLEEERLALEGVWAEALRRTNVPASVELDNALRFAGERARTCFGLEQLRVFALAEGRRIWR